jgi:hypothetical protein
MLPRLRDGKLHQAKATTNKVERKAPMVVSSVSMRYTVEKVKVETVGEGGDKVKVETVREGDEGRKEPKARGPEHQDKDLGGGDQNLTATKAEDSAIPVWLQNYAIHTGLTSDPKGRGHMEEGIN